MAPTVLDKLENERVVQKMRLTSFEGDLAGNATLALTQVEIDIVLSDVLQLKDEITELHVKILNCFPADINPYQLECMDLMKRTSSLERAFTALKKTSTSTSSNSSKTTNGASEIRLPRMELPTFSGDLNDWISFRDLFTTAIHDNGKISNAQKLVYLRSTLTGEAAKLVKSMASTDANYDIAWKILKDRFENERELLFCTLKRFMAQPVISGESAAALRLLIDVSKECMRTLSVLNAPIQGWDIILVYIIFQKLDSSSRQFWELSLQNTSAPKLDEFLEFLEQRARALASGASSANQSHSKPQHPTRQANVLPKKSFAHHADQLVCKVCSNPHLVYRCPTLLAMTVQERRETIKKHGLCFNCFRPSHQSAKCSSSQTCHTCKERHHTLLHMSKPAASSTNPSTMTPSSNSTLVLHSSDAPSSQGMLATALVKLFNQHGEPQLCRAFLDSGATTRFMTEACARNLGLSRSRTTTQVTGMGATTVARSKGTVTTKVHPYFHVPGDEAFDITMLVVPTITSNLPSQECNPDSWSHLRDLQLADPNFHKPAKIDILLGADLFFELQLSGKRRGPPGTPFGLNSKLGWLVAGNVSLQPSNFQVHFSEQSLDDSLQRFWELESVPTTRVLTPEEQMCERHFVSNTTRNDQGRYVVSFPIKPSLPDQAKVVQLGASRENVIRRLKGLERRLRDQPDYKIQYNDFMNEYLSLGHMIQIPPEEVHKPIGTTYYIPHHFVLKESSTTTKFRVVFDASSKTSSGVSLNERLMIGPTIQSSLVAILMRFRKHVVAFTADIAKMYRQIRMTPADTELQRIVWRADPSEEVKDYRLLTVTYGTASAPFHATRVLQQLSTDERSSFPLAANAAEKDFYVDDVMSGNTTDTETIAVVSQLVEMCAAGGLELRKFVSNDPNVLASLPEHMRETQLPLSMDKDDTVKTLGLHWNPGLDCFSFKVTLMPHKPDSVITKRILLSEMSKTFDPLGWLAPATIRAKILFQQMWKQDIDWDTPLPDPILQAWTKFRGNLPHIESLHINRCMMPPGTTEELTLHGFSDASEAAYSAVVYLRAEQSHGPPVISLITCKTRVAPSKTISVPRLELCGALLLAKLIGTVQESLKLNFKKILAWTDSTVVLDWLRSHPSKWQTFVANRVTEIQGSLPSSSWGHVRGIDNPADCASRGIDPTELLNHPLWWNGPTWLLNGAPEPSVEAQVVNPELVNAEQRRVVIAAATIVLPNSFQITKDPTFMKINRVTAWWRRFIHNCRNPMTKYKGPLTADEIDQALLYSVRTVQSTEFGDAIANLRAGKPLPSNSPLRFLNPFLDSTGLLRVGGRIRHSDISNDQRHPLLLPRHHEFTSLIIRHEHLQTFHGGSQLILTNLQTRFWIIRAKDAIRHIVRNCVACTTLRADTMQTLMGDLPKPRVTPTRPFLTCGVDYAGPFQVRAIPARSKVTFKAYLALFVCFSTRAIHLEVVSSLSTEAFLAALKRFTSRRGRSANIYSDCGTNFVGAARDLKELLALVNSSSHNEEVSNSISAEGMNWHFNPPGAPHFGGLWEAGVRSVKHHLHRVVGQARLTFEELTTVMTQIEACLNSRPLTACSSDPNDLTALTPGHFLIGESLLAIPEPDLTTVPMNRLTRWQMTQKLTQHFWHRWSTEYLSRLQQRPKWLKQRVEIQIGDLVLIKDDNLPPLKWKLGRVSETHPGADGITRVVTLKTKEGSYKRPIVKLCLLPVQNTMSANTEDA